jgi:hypothetical protein
MVDLGADPFKSLWRGRDRFRFRVQGTAKDLTVLVVEGLGHYCCSRTLRSAAIPRAVWLLTAPRLIPIVWAISASDKSP